MSIYVKIILNELNERTMREIFRYLNTHCTFNYNKFVPENIFAVYIFRTNHCIKAILLRIKRYNTYFSPRIKEKKPIFREEKHCDFRFYV